MAGLVGVRRKHVARKQIDGFTAIRAVQNLHPKEVERLARLAITVLGQVETLNLSAGALFDLPEEQLDFGPIDGTESNAN